MNTGEQASQTVVLYEDLISSKLDFLSYCTQWVWSLLSPEERYHIFTDLFSTTNDPYGNIVILSQNLQLYSLPLSTFELS